MRRKGLSLLNFKHRITAHSRAIKVGFPLSVLISNQLIHLYSEHGLIGDAQKLFDEMPQRNLFSWNTIISAQVKSDDLVQARALFDSAPHRDCVTYNSLLSGYVRVGGEFERLAFELFVDMRSRPDEMRIDEVTLTIMVNLCAKSAVLRVGPQLHGHMVKTATDLSGFAASSLIGMYSKCGCFREACEAFESCEADVDSVTKNSLLAACCRVGEMDMAAGVFQMATELNDAISWNTLIWGYVQNGCVDEIFDLFVSMREKGIEHDVHTFASLLIACSRLRNLNLGKEVHARVVKNGFVTNPFIRDGIVDVYCKCGNMNYAELLHFGTAGTASPFSITSMVAGYSSQGRMAEARKLFDSLIEKNAIAWTSLFSGYVKTQHCEAVFDLLSQFRAKEGENPGCLIIVSVLGACALQAALLSGKQVHGFALRTRIEMDDKMISATVDMYIKCGCLAYAEKIFQRVDEKDLVTYNVMLAGYAHHGDADKAIRLFRDMIKKGIPPDAITFVAILSACRHRGLVELGAQFFASMELMYNVLPESDHYACMIDLYGRANRLEDAAAFMERVPKEQRKCGVILGAFLNACKNAGLAREVEETLLEVRDDDNIGGGRYVQLANVYAAEGNWIEMQRVRKLMRGKETKKFAGCSWVYVDDKAQIFTSGDATHPRVSCVYSILHSLTAELSRKLTPIYFSD